MECQEAANARAPFWPDDQWFAELLRRKMKGWLGKWVKERKVEHASERSATGWGPLLDGAQWVGLGEAL